VSIIFMFQLTISFLSIPFGLRRLESDDNTPSPKDFSCRQRSTTLVGVCGPGDSRWARFATRRLGSPSQLGGAHGGE
jgi:hypothetical protein